MAGWVVKLTGDDFDLNAVAKVATEPDCRVTKEDGAYYLASTDFAAMQEPGEVHALATTTLLPRINGLMRLRNLNALPVSLDSVIRLNADGSRTHARFIVASAVLSGNSRITAEATVIGPDGVVVLSPEPAIFQSRFQLAQKHPAVADALKYWVACVPGDADFWINANKVFDIIRADVGNGNVGGGTQRIENNGWATRADIEGFGEAANNPAVSGGKARHGHGWTPKAPPMNEGEAVAFIQHLLDRWLDDKAAQAGLSVP